jgi:acyl dehydratase
MRYFEDIEPGKHVDSESNPRAGIARTKGVLTNQAGEPVLEVVTTGLFAKRPT